MLLLQNFLQNMHTLLVIYSISKNIVFKNFYTDIIMSIKYTINSSTKTVYTLNAIHEQNPHPDIMNDWKKFK